jgi:hypothetical protein
MKVIPENAKLDIYVLTAYLNNCERKGTKGQPMIYKTYTYN